MIKTLELSLHASLLLLCLVLLLSAIGMVVGIAISSIKNWKNGN